MTPESQEDAVKRLLADAEAAYARGEFAPNAGSFCDRLGYAVECRCALGAVAPGPCPTSGDVYDAVGTVYGLTDAGARVSLLTGFDTGFSGEKFSLFNDAPAYRLAFAFGRRMRVRYGLPRRKAVAA